MEIKHLHFALALAVATTIGFAGCALFKQPTTTEPIIEKAESVVEQVKPAVEYSLAVLQCAGFVQRMAFDSGKRLDSKFALAFCAALEASPDVAPATPPTATPETI